MAKKQVGVSLRKPPSADLDAFVGKSEPRTSDIRELAPIKAAPVDMVVKTDAGREMREMTIYLPVDLARKMSLRCVEKDRDASNLMADALAAHLADPVPAAAPTSARAAKKTTSPAVAAFTNWSRSMATLFRQRLAI